jgi:hypothetical protein
MELNRPMATNDLLTGLPGEELVREGLADLAAGQCTIAACLVSIGSSRLSQAGLLAPERIALSVEPERELYRLLRRQGGDADSRYSALLRWLVSFEHALDSRLARRARAIASSRAQ